jgi:hypothetical protein
MQKYFLRNAIDTNIEFAAIKAVFSGGIAPWLLGK